MIRYNSEGKPICEICGQAFERVGAHVRQAHNISARDYKLKFGLDLGKGLCSKKSSQKSREAVEKYPHIIDDLVRLNHHTRFKVGCKGRTKDMVSEQTRQMLSYRLKHCRTENMGKNMSEIGRSGIGNIVRWKKYEK